MSLKANLDKFAHGIIDHAKTMIIALHGEDEAKKLLPQLGDLLKKKADELLVKVGEKVSKA
jgi:hypothetical protein